ncbi:MAG: hypothetical protein JXA28_06840 [Bacteroidetes bacterium]|nr:hypothetical protein [Bacteroidota bacterium]
MTVRASRPTTPRTDRASCIRARTALVTVSPSVPEGEPFLIHLRNLLDQPGDSMMLRFHAIAAVLPFLLLGGIASAQQQIPVPRFNHSFSPHRSASVTNLLRLPDTVRVLAVMVDFQEDEDERTSGTGKFGTIYQYDYGTEILDPMPHDRAYFQHHLRFLENYVRKVSGRKTYLIGEVLDRVITVSKPLGEYSFRGEESEAPVAELSVEAWTLAGQQYPDRDFTAYDMFVVFHAGRGRDIDLVSIQGFDPTPLDIPSLSFTMDSFRRLLGEDFDGITMPGGARITNCAVIPTTNNREIPLLDGSTGLLELTINGLLAASFGTYAGLPDLFDTRTGKTGIGRFGLMDGEGIFAYGGICPPEPSAWEKMLLGWTVPREASPGRNNYLLTASDSLSTADVLRVPITGDEYWLAENRQRDLGGDGQNITFVSGGSVQQLRFPKDTTGFSNGDVSQLKGVIIDVEDIDWSLPGGRVVAEDREVRINGGILIWHIDEGRIRERLAANTVNTGHPIKGVDLEQAGGPQDIGVDVQTVFGTETGTGSPLDYWSSGNISPVYTNSFGMYTSPNTRANSGAFTHVTMDRFSAGGPVMSLDVALGDNTIAPMAGWPVDVSTDLGPNRTVAMRTADLDGDGTHEIIALFGTDSLLHSPEHEVLPDTVKLYVLRQDGSSFLPQGPRVFLDASMRTITPPTIGDWNEDGVADIAFVTRLGDVRATTHLWILAARDLNGDGMLDVQLRYVFSGLDQALLAPPAVIDGKLLFSVEGPDADTVYVVSSSTARSAIPHLDRSPDLIGWQELSFRILAMGESTALLTGYATPKLLDTGSGTLSDPAISWRGVPSHFLPQTAAAGDFDGDGVREAFGASYRGLGFASRPDDPDTLPFEYVELPSIALDVPVHAGAADADGDGRLDVLLCSGTELRAVNLALSSVDYYPAPYPARFTLSADLRSTGGNAVFGIGADQVWQFTTGAKQADGFPIPIQQNADVSLFPSADDKLALAAASPSGQLFLFETGSPVTEEQLLWRSRDGDERNAFAVTRAFTADAPIAEFFPPERCYNWPNPVYDEITYIRLYVSEDAVVSVKIYDLAGDKVDEITATVAGGTDNDIPWNVSGIQSDVYLARIQATAGGKTGEKIIKIAVVR